jgi:hypothetical protein
VPTRDELAGMCHYHVSTRTGAAHMTTIDKIKSEIVQLSDKELTALSDWLAEVEEQRFDRRIERDAAAGKLDKLMADAEANYKAGRRRPL